MMKVLTMVCLCCLTVSFSPGAHARGPMVGLASIYSDRFHGEPTSSGERYHKDRMTAAHRTLPIGTLVRVTHLRNGRSVIVRINDRGPYIKRRIIDLSREAAKKIEMVRYGISRVKLEVLAEK